MFQTGRRSPPPSPPLSRRPNANNFVSTSTSRIAEAASESKSGEKPTPLDRFVPHLARNLEDAGIQPGLPGSEGAAAISFQDFKIKNAEALPPGRKEAIQTALKSNFKVLWGETIVLDNYTSNSSKTSPVSCLTRLLDVTGDLKGMKKGTERLIRLPEEPSPTFYPADFLTLYSSHATPEERTEASDAIQRGIGGMNCYQFIYHCLRSQYGKYGDLFKLISQKAVYDENAAFEPLGYKKSRPFGYKPPSSAQEKLELDTPPEERSPYFQIAHDVFDKYSPSNPTPGDLIFFVATPPNRRDKLDFHSRRSLIKHVCMLVGLDKDDRLMVTGSYRYPLENGNTASTASLTQILKEVACRHSENNYRLAPTTLPLNEVYSSIDEYINGNRYLLDADRAMDPKDDESTLQIKDKFRAF